MTPVSHDYFAYIEEWHDVYWRGVRRGQQRVGDIGQRAIEDVAGMQREALSLVSVMAITPAAAPNAWLEYGLNCQRRWLAWTAFLAEQSMQANSNATLIGMRLAGIGQQSALSALPTAAANGEANDRVSALERAASSASVPTSTPLVDEAPTPAPARHDTPALTPT